MQNHSVVQSNFANPCVPIQNIMPNVTGFFSGFMPVKPTDSQKPTFTLMVNDTKPVWIYCAQGNHCQKGMVMAINAAQTGDKTLAAYTALAAMAPANLAPGQSASSGSSGMTGMNGTTTTGGSGTPPPPPPPPSTGGAGATGTGGITVASGTSTAPITVSTGAAASLRVLSGTTLAGAVAAFMFAM